ncbi:hypothetical protein F5879DRAFT_1018674 [Lentinula edodes]|nr:hypothetical protein F5879DRAFT_1018674 [Lentinula edodes]
MAKGKKGKQKQDFIQPQPQTTTVPLAALPEEPPKVYDDGVSGMMEMGQSFNVLVWKIYTAICTVTWARVYSVISP